MKKIVFNLFLLFNTFFLFSQSIEQAFINIPEQYFPQLSKNKRTELLFRFHVLKLDTITNNFKGISTILDVDNKNYYLKMKPTETSFFEEKIWVKKDSTKIIGFNHIVCGPICDSHVAFFNQNYERIDEKENDLFPEITIADFIDKEKIKKDELELKNIINKHDIFFTSIYFPKTGNDIFLETNIDEYLPEEIYKELKPYLLGNKMELEWEDGLFKKGEIKWK